MKYKIFQRHLRRLMDENEITFEFERRTGTKAILILKGSTEDCKNKNVKLLFQQQGKAK